MGRLVLGDYNKWLMDRRFYVALMLVGCGGLSAAGQVLPPGAMVKQLATGYAFTEGPVYDGAGGVLFTNLIFSNQFSSDIVRYNIGTGVATVVDPNSDGANGLFLDNTGQVVSCDQATHRVTRRAAADITNNSEVLASSWNGQGFNSPNDLVIDAAGGIYFTDPDYNGVGKLEGVYYRNTAGVVSRILSGFSRPNGIILSPGGETLYLALEAEKRIMAYDVGPGGAISNQRQFKSTSTDAAGNPHSGHGPDGLGMDAAGNLYAAVQNEIWAWSPSGQLLFELPVPQDPTNVAFGGADGRTLFITAQTSLYGVELNVPSPALGDFDGDGTVTAADYAVWRDSFGSTVKLAADGNGNRMIDSGDYDVWIAHFGNVLGAGSSSAVNAAVPEPTGLALFFLAVAVCETIGRRSALPRKCGARRPI
jgi:gluconolactonase